MIKAKEYFCKGCGSMGTISVAVIGAGNRGNIYSDFALRFPEKLKVVAVAEPSEKRRISFSNKHGIKDEYRFFSYEEFFSREKICDAVFVTTQDDAHFEPVMKALNKGYHVLVEKPMSPSLEECYEMVRTAREKNKLLMLGYVLRYTPFFQKIKKLLNNYDIGTVRHVSIDMSIAYWHFAHSFVRGNWRDSNASSPMILAKACHDLDIIYFLLDSSCKKISSFGQLVHFKKDNAPINSGKRCDECNVEEDCPYSARKLYLQDNVSWPVNTICDDMSIESRQYAVKSGQYGRCVYSCDNNVVDHQVVTMEFNNNATATLTASAFTNKLERNVRILGTHGEIEATLSTNTIIVSRFGQSERRYTVNPSSFGMHAGGDYGLLEMFCHKVAFEEANKTDSEDTIFSHIYAHMAELSRLQGETIYTSEFLSRDCKLALTQNTK